MPTRPLSKSLQNVALKELNEVPGEIQATLEHLRDWITKQPHLKCRLDDRWLLTFLRGCKFNLQKTKQKLDSYYTVRTTIPEYFGFRDPFLPEVDEYCKQRICVQCILPETDESALPAVAIVRVKNYNDEVISYDTLMKICIMTIDLALITNDRLVIAGAHGIIDLKELKPSLLKYVSPTNLKNIAVLQQQAFPLRLKGVHFINCPGMFISIYNALKSFLPKKLSDRIRLYSEENTEDIYNILPKAVFPKEYGGDAGQLDDLADQLNKNLKSHRDWFLDDDNYSSDESKRPQHSQNFGEYGVQGSFRKLTID